jgi:hypothetical protein
MTWTDPRPVTVRFAVIMDGLRKAVAESHHLRGVPGPLVGLIWAYVGRIMARFAKLAEQIRTGTLPAPRTPRPAAAPPDAPQDPLPRAPRKPSPLPRGKAWLVALVGYQAAGCGSQLQHLIADPGMQALLAATPRMGRLLRPLCRMLAAQVAPDLLPPPPPRPRPVKPPRPPAPPRPPRVRERKLRWKCAKPPASGLIFY